MATKAFLDDVARTLTAIRSAVAAEDPRTVVESATRLEAAAESFGAEGLRRAAQTVAYLAGHQHVPSLVPCLRLIEVAVGETHDTLAAAADQKVHSVPGTN